MSSTFKYEVSVILPSLNEGESVAKVVDEVIQKMKEMNLTYEIIAIDTPSQNESFDVYKRYADLMDNFTAVALSETRQAGSGKTVQYMTGFELARGKYIVHLDTDGQDNFADFHQFYEKLEDGYHLVVGHKQKRKDAAGYMFWSKVGNSLTRVITGTDVHDMNCGFKAYQSHVAKSLNLKGRWYRYIPSIVQSKGYTVTEVPIENRKREWGKSNFNFFNRMQAGLFDMLVIAILNRYRDTQMYFWGWVSVLFIVFATLLFILTFLLPTDILKVGSLVFSGNLYLAGVITYLTGINVQFKQNIERTPIIEYGIKEIYKGSAVPEE